MDVKFNPFPVVYLNARCLKHDALLELVIQENKRLNSPETVGAQITSVRCMKAGHVSQTDCMDTWQMSILGALEVTIGM